MNDMPYVRETPLRTFRLSLICPKCGEEMKSTGPVGLSCPASYPHVCLCGFKHTVRGGSYPKIDYRDVKETT